MSQVLASVLPKRQATKNTEAARSLWERYEEQDARLVAAGFPPTSEWWKRRFRRLLEGGKRRGVFRVGRRGGKSSSCCRLAVVVALHGGHMIPPGDAGIIGVVSVTKPEARNRLRTLTAILTALGYTTEPVDGGFRIVGTRLVAQCFAATLGGVVGGTWVFALFDEVARWKDSDTGVNPATEVLASARPTMATMPNALEVMCSSPMGEFDAHFDAMAEGDNEAQDTYQGATWEANPTLTEADTRKLETDEAIWRREYAAIPSSEVYEGLLTAHDLDITTRRGEVELEPAPGHTYVATMDPATRGNAWTFAVGTADARGRLVVSYTHEWQGTQANPLDPGEVLRAMDLTCRRYGVQYVYTDQHAGDELVSLAREIGVSYEIVVAPWTHANRLSACLNLRTRARSEGIELPATPALRADLLGIRLRITRTGIQVEFPRVGARHCDFAPTIAKLATLDITAPRHDHEQSDTERARARRRQKVADGERPWWES